MASATIIRPGKCKPDMTFLRQFPGKRRFERVSKDDWNEPLPHKDIGGYGHILRLEADVRVFSPDGGLQVARKWPSRSYIRNFARILRNIFGSSVQLVDRGGTVRSVALNNAPGIGGVGFLPAISEETTFTGSQAADEHSGAGFAIGSGVAAEVHTRNDLVSRFSEVVSARQGVRTTVLNTSTLTLEMTGAIVNGTAASVNITEMALYLLCLPISFQVNAIAFSTLIAYDGITSTPLAAGGVIAPRYTMDFPM